MLRFAAPCLILLVGVVLLFTDGSTAGEKPKPKQQQLPIYWKELGLSTEQKKKVYEVQAKYREQMAELEAKIKELEAKMVEERFKVLSDSQREQLKQIYAKKAGGGTGEKKPDEKKTEVKKS